MDNFLSEVKCQLDNLSSYSRVHIVIGNESCDLDSAVSAITYAFYLNTKSQREATPDVPKRETILTVPLLNIFENQFRLRTETIHFFRKCNIQASNLIFKDQIDLKSLYADDRLVLTLVDHNVLTGDFTRFEDTVVEVIDHRLKERIDNDRVRLKLDLVGSCCTLIAEELLSDPDFHLDETVAQLLYGTILVDTINRSPDAGKITPRDENVLHCLEEVLPNIEGDKLFNDIQAAKFDISGLLNMEILEKDLKRVAGTAMTIAMSSVTMDMKELVVRPNFKEDLNKFCIQENCEVVVIMTLVNDEDRKPARQIAVYSENRIFRDQIADTLDNSEDIDLELELVTPPFDEISVFQQGNVKASRKNVLPILKSFLVGDTTPDVASKDFVSVHTVSMPTEGFTSVLGVPESSNVHFTLDSIDELSDRNSFEENGETQGVDLLGLNVSTNGDDNNSNNIPNQNLLDFDPLATITSLDEESPPKDIQNDSTFGKTQNPFDDFGDFANSNNNVQNANKPSANFSSANFSSAHSSNIFDLGISDSELMDPFSSVDETGSQILPNTNPTELKVNESGENEPKDADTVERDSFRIENPFNIDIPQDNDININNSNTSNPFPNIVDVADDSLSNNVVNFQLNHCDNGVEGAELLTLEDNSGYSTTTKTNPFSSGTFLEVDAYKSDHPLSYKSPSLIVECDERSQADDLAELEESELFDKIPTPEIEHSGESSPFIMSGTGTPYEVQSEYHSRTVSESGSGMPEMVVPPNSLMDQGYEPTDRQLPSFNNAEMVAKINRKKASLGDLIPTEESAEENIDLNVPFTPANSFLDNSGENLMRDNSLPNLLTDSEMLQKVQQKRDSLQANLDLSENFDDQSNPFETNPFKRSNVEETSSSVETTFTSNDNPFFQLDGNTSDNMLGNQSNRGSSLDKTGSSDVFNIFGGTGGSNSTSLDNQVGSETGSLELFDATDFGTQSKQPSQNATDFGTLSTQPRQNATDFGTQSMQPSQNATDFGTLSTQPSQNATDFGTQSTQPSQNATDFGTQSTQPSQNLNPFVNDLLDVSVGTSILSNQTVTIVSELSGAFDQENNADQSMLEVINKSANLEAADVVSESIAREIIHDAIEIFPDLKNPKLAESVLTNAEHEGAPIWTQQGSGDSGIGSTDSPQQAPKARLQSLGLNSEVSVETEYLPGMDPLHGSLNIVTSPASQTHSVETDADKEVVEGESFRKISEAFIPEHSSLSSNQMTLQQPDLPEQIREMIINRNINTTADNIQTSTSVDKVVSPDEEDTLVSLDKDYADIPTDNVTKVVSPDEEGTVVSLDKDIADLPTDNVTKVVSPDEDIVVPLDKDIADTCIPKDNVTNVVSPDEEDTVVSYDKSKVETGDAKFDIQNDNDKKPPVNTADIDNDNCLDVIMETPKSNISDEVVDKDLHDVQVADLLGDFFGSGPVDAVEDNTQECFRNDAVAIEADNVMITLKSEESEKNIMHGNAISTIISSGSDNSISSDSSSSFQSTSESELVTVRENTVKFSDHADIVLTEEPEEDCDSIDTNKIMDLEGLENVTNDVDEDLIGKTDDTNFLEVADKLVKDTFAQVLEQEKARIFEGQELLIADNKDEVEEGTGLSNNVHSEIHVSSNEQSDADKEFVVEKSDIVADQTPVLINSLLTESALTIESISPVETPLEEHASGFYEVNPEDKNKDVSIVDLSDSSYQTNLGENETGFYDFNNEDEGKEDGTGSPKELVGIHMTSYEDNALKLNSVIDNDNKNFLMLDEDYSDASVSPLETPEFEYVKGFYDINADNLELAIAKTESLNICDSLTAESTYSDSSVSPIDTPSTESVGGFYELSTSVADMNGESSVAIGKQLGPDDAPKINIELVDTPETSKDSFDSETESCFEETEEIKNEGIISETNDEENVAKNRSVRFDVSTKFPEDMMKSTETVESQDSDIEGFYELNAELEGGLLQNIDVGNPFSPIESPNEDVFTLDYEINPCVPDLTKQNSDDEEHIEERPKKSYVSFFNDVKEENEKVEEMADFLVETALNEAISTLSDEKSDLTVNHENEAEPSCNYGDHLAGMDNEAEDIVEEGEPHVEKYEDGLYEVADQLVDEAISSAIEIVQEMTLDSETYRDPITGESNRIFSDSSDSETSSTTTEGSYRIDHSSELATPDRDGIAAADLDVNSTVDDFNNDESTLDENISTLHDLNVSGEILGDQTVLFENTVKDDLQTQYSEPDVEENKENIKVKTADSLDLDNELYEIESSMKEAVKENEDKNAQLVEEPQILNDENGNITEEIVHEHDISAEIDFDEEDTSRFDDDTNTSMDVKSPDGPSYYKYDSFELDDKEVPEKSKTLNRQGTIIPDIIISMDDSPPVVDEAVKGSRRLGNYKPEIIDLSHETEDEISEKDDSDNVSEASVDTNLVTEEIVQEVNSEVESVISKSNINSNDVVENDEKTTAIANKTINDANKDLDESNKEPPNNAEAANMDHVKHHNIKDLESEKKAKKSGKVKGEVDASENATSTADGSSLGQDEYVTRKEIFYTSAGRLSVSIDSVVDPPSEGEGETESNPQQPKKPIDDDDDLSTEQSEQIETQSDKQKVNPLNQEKMKVMEEAQEWHEDPIPGMGVTQESSSDESDSDSDSEYAKPARPDTLLNGARKKKKITATNNLLTPDSTDDLIEGVDNIPTPDDLETPSDLEGELEWEDDTPMTPASDTKKFVEYRDDEAEREKYENTKFRKVEIAGKDYRVDMKVIEPYKKVLSHGGYYGDGLNAIILFCGCYLPDRGRRDYQYVMDNLFLYVISTLELLVAEDYMIVYFHGATPRRQMPSFGWLKRCYQMIDRRLRKNLKGLLMVHPTLWLKTVVVMTKPFISSKFSSKLRFVKTLKELGKIVPMEYIYVPEPVSQYDGKLYQHRPCTSTPVTPSSS